MFNIIQHEGPQSFYLSRLLFFKVTLYLQLSSFFHNVQSRHWQSRPYLNISIFEVPYEFADRAHFNQLLVQALTHTLVTNYDAIIGLVL